MPQTGVRNSLRRTTSSQTAGTWCCQMPPPRKLRFRSQVSLRASRSSRCRRSAGLGGERRRQLERALHAVRGRDLREERLDVGDADRVEQLALERPASSSACTDVRSRGHPVDERTPRRDVDAAVAAEQPRRARGRRCRRAARRIEREELAQAGDHLDVLGADAAQDGRAELLVAAAEQRALAADDADRRASPARRRAARAARARRGRRRRRRPASTASTPSSVFGSPRCRITRRVVVPGPST